MLVNIGISTLKIIFTINASNKLNTFKNKNKELKYWFDKVDNIFIGLIIVDGIVSARYTSPKEEQFLELSKEFVSVISEKRFKKYQYKPSKRKPYQYCNVFTSFDNLINAYHKYCVKFNKKEEFKSYIIDKHFQKRFNDIINKFGYFTFTSINHKDKVIYTDLV